jgi:hypothetical protein
MNHRPGIEELRKLAATATDPKVQEAYRQRLEMTEDEVSAILCRRMELDKQLNLLRGSSFSHGRAYERLLKEIIDLECQLDPEYNERQHSFLYPQ